MPPAPLLENDDEAYNSASDSDFDASLSPSSGEDSGDAGDRAKIIKSRTKKRKVDADGDLEMGSGDEGIIAQGRKKKQKKGKGKGKGKGKKKEAGEDADGDNSDEDEVAVGIRVKLRSGRGGQEKTKSSALPTVSAATGDISSIWARMNAPSTPSHLRPPPPASKSPPSQATTSKTAPAAPVSSDLTTPSSTPKSSDTIQIPHTYTFAGETHTSLKTVPRSSPAAIAFLSSQQSTTQISSSSTPQLRRPLARKNLLDPNPSRQIKGVPSEPRSDLPASIGGNGAKVVIRTAQWEEGKRKGRKKEDKLNTVEKSKMDWESVVEREGLKEELEKAEKSGGSYLGRMEFLGRVGERGDEEDRRARGLAAPTPVA